MWYRKILLYGFAHTRPDVVDSKFLIRTLQNSIMTVCTRSDVNNIARHLFLPHCKVG